MLSDKNHCTGCLACKDSCDFNAISIEYDKDGFFYPIVNSSLCQNCRKCEKICPIIRNSPHDQYASNIQAYSAINVNKEALLKSSSGGVFDAFCRLVRESEGYIAACCFENDFEALHRIISANDDYRIFQGSKYIQSNTMGIYKEVKLKLDNGKLVLFVGTPCQVDALNSFLRKKYDNLITLDFVCHGVPSPLLWSNYKQYIESHRGRLVNFSFREKKKFGWGLYFSYSYYNKKNKIKEINAPESIDAYYHSFLTGLNYRESCYNCRYSNLHRPADFSMGDLWGGKEEHITGASLLLVNNEKAQKLLNSLQKYLKIEAYDLSLAVANQHNLKLPTERPIERDDFYTKILKNGIDWWVNSYKKSKVYIRAQISYHIPIFIKKTIKSIIRKK